MLRRAGRRLTQKRIKQRNASVFPIMVNGVTYTVHHNKFGYCAENKDGIRVTGNVASVALLEKELGKL